MNVELVGHTNSANTNANDLAELSRQRVLDSGVVSAFGSVTPVF